MRRHNFQNIAWFYDIHKRGLLNLEPPYQRRSVWNQSFRDYFIDTILLDYPAPAIFLYEEMDVSGETVFNVVDGKQRLTTVLGFLNNEFPVSEEAFVAPLHGYFFRDFDRDVKLKFFSYEFLVEYIPTSDDIVVSNIFDRINKNVARLTPQELRHAKYSGHFITVSEELTEYMLNKLVIPKFNHMAIMQMRDVELVSHLLCLIENEPCGISRDEMDNIYSNFDTEWNNESTVKETFLKTIDTIYEISLCDATNLKNSRYGNQADFYSLFGALVFDYKENIRKDIEEYYTRFMSFAEKVNDLQQRNQDTELIQYFYHVQSNSTGTNARKERIRILREFVWNRNQ